MTDSNQVAFLKSLTYIALLCASITACTANHAIKSESLSEIRTTPDSLCTCTPTLRPTNTRTPIPTYTSTATSSPTYTPTPSPTPQGGITRFLLRLNGLYLSDVGEIVTKFQIENRIGKKFDSVSVIPSPDFSSALILTRSRGLFGRVESELYLLNCDQITFLASSPTLAPFWSPDSNKIALVQIESRSTYISIMNKDGSGKYQVGVKTGYDGFPLWSPDGSRIYWTRYGKFRVIDVETGSNRPLGEVDWLDDWYQVYSMPISPDGTRIAFTNQNNLYILDADFTDPTIFEFPGYGFPMGGIMWSPSSNELLVRGHKTCSNTAECEAVSELRPDFFLVYLDGETNLVSTELIPSRMNYPESSLTSCGFTPDGQNLLFPIDDGVILLNSETGEITGQLPGVYGCPVWVNEEDIPILEMLALSPNTLQEGSLSDYLRGYRTEYEGDVIRIDNSGEDEWFGFDADPVLIKAPFNIEIMMRGEGGRASLSLSGRTNYPGGEWWEGIHRLYIHAELDNVLFEFCGGVSEMCTSFPVPIFLNEDTSPFTVRFLDRFGKVIEVYTSKGERIGFFNLQNGDVGKGLENGLLPDGKLFVGVLLSPGASIEISKLEVQIAE